MRAVKSCITIRVFRGSPSETLMRVIFIVLTATGAAISLSPGPAGQNRDMGTVVRPIDPTAASVPREVELFPLGDAKVVAVTSLSASGPGSLRAALRAKGPRLVVFEVGGVIDLQGRPLQIDEPFVFVAGETAPHPGITLIRGSLLIETDHVVVRHLAVRPGDGRSDPAAAWQPDGITVARDGRPTHDVLIQNCSATWAVDENMSASGPRDTRPAAGPDATAHGVSFRDNLIAEALLNSTHEKGPHSMGLLVHDGIRDITISGNLFAHNRERNPRLKGGVVASVTGNVVYNWGSAAIGVGSRGNLEVLEGVRAVVRNNVAIAGPDTKGRVLVRALDPGASVEAAGNLARDAGGKDLKELDTGITALVPPPGSGNLESSPAATLTAVLRGAGSRPAERDAIDRRIVESVISGAGRIIDSQSQVGGYPVRPESRRPVRLPAGASERRAFLQGRMADLATDRDLDLTPLLNRLKLPR